MSTDVPPAIDTEPTPPREGYFDTIRRLGGAQKNGRGPAYLRFVNRKFGRPFAAAAYHLGLGPNHVTATSALFTFSGLGLLAVATPSTGVGVGVALLLLVGFALDSADGQLARLQGGGSLSGEWLDHVVDGVKVAALHLAVLISLYRGDEVSDRWLLVPLGYSVVGVVAYTSHQLHEQMAGASGHADRSNRSALNAVLLLPTDYGVLCMTFVLLGSATWFLGAYGALFVLCTLHLVYTMRKRFAELRAIDAGRSS